MIYTSQGIHLPEDHWRHLPLSPSNHRPSQKTHHRPHYHLCQPLNSQPHHLLYLTHHLLPQTKMNQKRKERDINTRNTILTDENHDQDQKRQLQESIVHGHILIAESQGQEQSHHLDESVGLGHNQQLVPYRPRLYHLHHVVLPHTPEDLTTVETAVGLYQQSVVTRIGQDLALGHTLDLGQGHIRDLGQGQGHI